MKRIRFAARLAGVSARRAVAAATWSTLRVGLLLVAGAAAAARSA